jgi:hypothetical protein
MKSIAILILTALSLPAFGQSPPANDALSREFSQLREQRNKALSQAAEPINRRYAASLEQLFRRATQAANLELATSIKAELQSLGGSVGADPMKPAPALATAQGSPSELKRLFEETQWAFYQNASDEKPVTTWVFRKDGKLITNGHYQSWDVEAPNILKVFRDSPNSKGSQFRAYRVDPLTKVAEADKSLSTVGGTGPLKFIGPARRP